MSLINDMLRDLEKRRPREACCVASSKKPVVVDGPAATKYIFLAGGILLLAALVWLGVTLIPGILPIKSPVATFSEQHEGATVVEKASSTATTQDGVAKSVPDDDALVASALVPAAPPAVSDPLTATLLSLGIVETIDSAQLGLTFAQLPEYRLLQNGIGMAQLVVSFNQTQIGTDFEIPQLTGTLLKRVSLLPKKQSLQLLVDLDPRALVQSFQVVDGPGQGYRLLIDIAVVAPVAEQTQKQLVVPEPSPTVVEKIAEVEEFSAPKVSKNQNRLSRDREAYRAGLEQLTRGDFVAAEASFNQALIVNPELVEARLPLVELLQQQKQLVKAENFLQQGLSIAPGNADLRKVYARLLLNDQRQGEALDLLQAEPLPGISHDVEYHALLAALLREAGQFSAASSVYGQLVQVRPEVALWWMGLAISLEQSGSLEQARYAYQQALNLPGLQADLQNYIQSRLQTL